MKNEDVSDAALISQWTISKSNAKSIGLEIVISNGSFSVFTDAGVKWCFSSPHIECVQAFLDGVLCAREEKK